MHMTTTQKIILSVFLIVVAGAIIISRTPHKKNNETTPQPPIETSGPELLPVPDVTTEKPTPPPVVNEGPVEGQEYYFHTMTTTDISKELTDLVGADNIMAVLQTNRVDLKNIKQGSKIVIPVAFGSESRSPFPTKIDSLSEVPKIIVFAQRVQAFGAYEYGTLVRWGPTSTGKQSTKTPNGLFSTNWKGKEVKSSFDDEWILKYNFNINNFEGIGFHQYEMPGYPASHSCLRLLMPDAVWLYDWAEQWVLSPDGNTRLAHGTPVIVFGDYGFGKTAPWKLLPTNPDATDISLGEITTLVEKNISTIMERQTERQTVLAQ